jgi:hypothetical protein
MIRKYLFFLAIVVVALVTAVHSPDGRTDTDHDDSKQLSSHTNAHPGCGINAPCHAQKPAPRRRIRQTGPTIAPPAMKNSSSMRVLPCRSGNIQLAPHRSGRSSSHNNIGWDRACATCHAGLDEVEYGTAKNMLTMAPASLPHDHKATNQCGLPTN